MSAANSALDLTMHLINMGGNSDGGWIPGNGLPTSQIGIVGNRYVDVQTGDVYGPKTRTGWPEEASYTLNLGNVTGEFANMLARVPALEVGQSSLNSRVFILEGKATASSDLAAVHHTTLLDHAQQLAGHDASITDIYGRLNIADTELAARVGTAEIDIVGLKAREITQQDLTNVRFNELSTELDGNGSSITNLQTSFTSFTQTWAQDVTTLRSEFNGSLATLTQTLTTQASELTATASVVTALTANVQGNAAALTQEATVRADADSAMAQQIATLTASVGTSLANFSSTQTAMVTDVEAFAASVESLNATVGENQAAFLEETTALATEDEALSQRITTLTATTGEITGMITTEQTARIDGDSAVVALTQTLLAESEEGTSALISQESVARLEGDQAEAYQRSLLSAQLETDKADLQATIAAETTARVTAIGAETTARNNAISTVNTSIGQVSAAVDFEASTRAQVDGYLGSQVTLSTSVGGGGRRAVAGLQISATSEPGKQTQSDFVVFADKFVIAHTADYTGVAPFYVLAGVVYIDTARIRDGTITNAKMGTASIGTLNVAGGAVTSMAYGEGSTNHPGGAVSLCACYLSLPAGATGSVVSATVNLVNSDSGSWVGVWAQIVANGNVIAQTYVSLPQHLVTSTSVSGFHSNPANGTNTYELRLSTDPSYPGAVAVPRGSITATGGKR